MAEANAAAKAGETQTKTQQAAEKTKQNENSGTRQESFERTIPRDFPVRLSTKILSISERELDEEIASSRIAALAYRNLKDSRMHSYFFDVTKLFLGKEDAEKYAATLWTALLWHQEDHPEYREFMENIARHAISRHYLPGQAERGVRIGGREFTEYGYLIGEVFIQIMRLNNEFYDVLSEFFGFLIRDEMDRNLNTKKQRGKKRRFVGRKKQSEEQALAAKKLYDDIVDYVSHRGEFRSDTLNQKNPNEFIQVLADRMRNTRRYVIQDIMNKNALEKKKLLEKEFREREASAEEVIMAAEPFSRGLFLYWVEKRYNFKYLAVEKVRITLQILGITMGMAAMGTGFLGLQPLTLFEGIFIGAIMAGFSKTICSRYFFAPYFPTDVTAELERKVGTFTPIFRKFSLIQMNSFLSKQVRNPDNHLLLHLLPEYMKYIFAVMPDRSDILLTKDETNEFMERMEVNLSKQQRLK